MLTLRSISRSNVAHKRGPRARRLQVEHLEPRALMAGLKVLPWPTGDAFLSATVMAESDAKSVQAYFGGPTEYIGAVGQPSGGDSRVGTRSSAGISGSVTNDVLGIGVTGHVEAFGRTDHAPTAAQVMAGTGSPVELQIEPGPGEKVGDLVDVTLHPRYDESNVSASASGSIEISYDYAGKHTVLIGGLLQTPATDFQKSFQARIGDSFTVTVSLSATASNPGVPQIPAYATSSLSLSATVTTNPTPTEFSCDYMVIPRYGQDLNDNNLIDLPNTYTYANPTTLDVLLTVTADPAADATTQYRWDVYDAAFSPVLSTDWTADWATPITLPVALNADGELSAMYNVVCTRKSAGVSDSAEIIQPMILRDILMVSMGDSYSSGEGNPEVPATVGAQWADGADGYYGAAPYGTMNEENRQAHRSTQAATSQYALALEQMDPHTSVTFVFVSQSGAVIPDALAPTPKEGKLGCESTPIDQYHMPGEIAEIAKIIGSRQIDQLFISMGGNDIGFADIADDLSKGATHNQQAIATFQKNFGIAAGKGKEAGWQLANRYDALDAALYTTLQLNMPDDPRQVFVTEYPDPASIGPNEWGPMLNDIPGRPGTTAETSRDVVYKQVVVPLDNLIQRKATQFSWTYVTGITAAFVGHGYATTDRYVRTFQDMLSLQGMSGFPPAARGILHPSKEGHDAIAAILMNVAGPYIRDQIMEG